MSKTITIIVPEPNMTVEQLTAEYNIVDSSFFDELMMYSSTFLIEGQTFEIPVEYFGSDVSPELTPEPESDSPYLYADEGIGSEIDVAILQNALDKIEKQEALGTAITYFDSEQENPALHAYLSEIAAGDQYPIYSFEGVEHKYAQEVLMALFKLSSQSEIKMDPALLWQGLNVPSDLQEDFEYFLTNSVSEDEWELRRAFLLRNTTDFESIDLKTVQSLLIEQIMLSEGSVPEEDLSSSIDLLNDYADAVEFDENYEAILAQAIADVEAWDGEAEQQLLDELWAKIQIMHETGGVVAGQPVGNIIGAFERYHKAMTDHQGTMAYWTELKDQLTYLQMSPEEKSNYHKNNLLTEYLDKYGLEYSEDESLDTLMDMVFADLVANPDRFETYIGSQATTATTIIDRGDYNAYSDWLTMSADSLANPIDTIPFEIMLFFAGFVPILGQATDVLDFVTSLARGDVAGAAWNLIPMIGDVVSGFRRIARKGSSLHSTYKASYPNMTDVTDKIDALEGVTRQIDKKVNYLKNTYGVPKYLSGERLGDTPPTQMEIQQYQDIMAWSDEGRQATARNLGIDTGIVTQAYRHMFLTEDEIEIFGIIQKGQFTPDFYWAHLWNVGRRGVADQGEIENLRRLVAHEYIESKLMESGIPFYHADEFVEQINDKGIVELVKKSTNQSYGADALSFNFGYGDFRHWESMLGVPYKGPQLAQDLSNIDEVVNYILENLP